MKHGVLYILVQCRVVCTYVLVKEKVSNRPGLQVPYTRIDDYDGNDLTAVIGPRDEGAPINDMVENIVSQFPPSVVGSWMVTSGDCPDATTPGDTAGHVGTHHHD